MGVLGRSYRGLTVSRSPSFFSNELNETQSDFPRVNKWVGVKGSLITSVVAGAAGRKVDGQDSHHLLRAEAQQQEDQQGIITSLERELKRAQAAEQEKQDDDV